MSFDRQHPRVRRLLTVVLLCLIIVGQVKAGLTITNSNGIAMTGADGVVFGTPSGIAMTGADGFLTLGPNGIAMTGADGLLPVQIGANGVTFTGPDGIAMTGADGIAMTGADGIAMTGADGIAMTGADGKTIQIASLFVSNPTGIVLTSPAGGEFRGVDGYTPTSVNSFTMDQANGVLIHGAQGIAMTGADSATVTMLDGSVASVSPNGIAMTGADGIAMTGADGITATGVAGLSNMTPASLTPAAVDNLANAVGLQSVDPELALTLNRATDDSNLNAIVVYHRLPTDSDITDLQGLGILGGTRYHALPMIAISATKKQIIAVSHLPAVRSIYGVRTLQLNSDPYMAATGNDRVATDADLTRKNQGLPLSGHNVTVAVLDTGVDSTHPDLAGRVIQNVKLADSQSLGTSFIYPVDTENLPNTDQAYGHGTFVAGIIAGSGQSSGGKYAGVAPGAQILGLSAGDLTLTFVLAGFDYLLQRGAQYNVRAVNCSFSANTVFDFDDPVNVATKMLTDSGISVVFSAGNSGPGADTLNPYAVAPWVVSVGATDQRSHLADFSSRGEFGNPLFKPTLVAPGVSLISLRAVGVTGAEGVAGSDQSRLSPANLPYYTTASGTSFSAPQVSATIALMLEANPSLAPAQIRQILQLSSTPLPNYYQHEVGSGMLNTYAATLEAAFPQRRFGLWRTVLDFGQASFINDPAQLFSGTVTPGTNATASLTIPGNALLASVQIGWGPFFSANNLGLTVLDQNGQQQGTSNALNIPGLTGKRQSVDLTLPSAGTWQAQVFNSLGAVGTSQSFVGSMQVTHVQYAPLRDISRLSSSVRNDILQSLRTFVVTPYSAHYYPNFAVTRSDLAASLVRSGATPQYLASAPHYSDVTDVSSRNFVESAQLQPGGPLFPESQGSTTFQPNAPVDRVTAAVVLVRAAGLQSEAQQNSGALLLMDLTSVPLQWRGYVAVALKHGLLTADNNLFHPQSGLTRADLAHALVVLQQLAMQ